MNSKPYKRAKNKVIMQDGTVYEALSEFDNIRGKLFDQVIFVDDYRWNIFKDKQNSIEQIYHYLRYSYVPETYQQQLIEW